MSFPADNTLCPGCFEAPRSAGACPRCGFDVRKSRSQPHTALPPGTVLHGQYVLGRLLGKPGGFGLTYLAYDRHLETRVAIKEFLPRELAARGTDQLTVLPHGPEEKTSYRYGLEQFLAEARTLAKLDHPNIARVRTYFEANGSAYLVMDYYRGSTLAETLAAQPKGRLKEHQALALIQPILDGLAAVHAQGILHRDVKPANIYLARTDAGSGAVRPILLDFGAARQAMGERSRSLSVILTPGYAPFEQYHSRGHQGTWSDIYAAAAVLYRMLTGQTPPEANARMDQDDLRPASAFGISDALSKALDKALALRVGERTQDVAAFRHDLSCRVEPPPPPPPPPDPDDPPEPKSIPMRRGLSWIGGGWNLFTKAPFSWIGAVVAYMLINIALPLVPVIGSIITVVMSPVLLAGFMAGAHEQTSGGKFRFKHLSRGFSKRTAPLFRLGGLLILGSIVLGILGALLMAGLGMLIWGSPEGLFFSAWGLILAFTIFLALMTPLAMAYWFAPALVMLNGLGAFAAMKISFLGCRRNILPFIIYGLSSAGLITLAVIPVGLGLLILFPVLIAAIYSAYQEIFSART